MNKVKDPKQAVIDKHATNEQLVEAMGAALKSGKPVLYAVEDHGIENQSWGYFAWLQPADPISGVPGTLRRAAGPISDTLLENGTYEVGQPIKIQGLAISRTLTLDADAPGASPLANRQGEQLTSEGRPVFQVMKLSFGKKDDNAGITIDRGTGTKIAK